MMKDTIKDYFLDKPGTFEDHDRSHITLNLASEKIVELHQNYVDIKLNKSISNQLLSKLDEVKPIQDEGEFQWSQIQMDAISFSDLCELIDQSYESVISTLPEDEQREILDLEW